METQIKKLITEYQHKVEGADTMLKFVEQAVRQARKESRAEDLLDSLNEKKLLLTQRQCYIQIISYLKSILGEI